MQGKAKKAINLDEALRLFVAESIQQKKNFCQFVLERSKNRPEDNWKSSQKLLRAIKLIFRYMDMLLLKEICDDLYGNKTIMIFLFREKLV